MFFVLCDIPVDSPHDRIGIQYNTARSEKEFPCHTNSEFYKIVRKIPSNRTSLHIAANLRRGTKFIEHQTTLVSEMDDDRMKDGMAFIKAYCQIC